MTVGELLCRIGAWELDEWKVIYSEQPFGVERDNFHSGIVAASVYNVQRKKGSEPVRADAFIIKSSKEHREDNLSAAIGMLSKMALPITKKELKRKRKAKAREKPVKRKRNRRS